MAPAKKRHRRKKRKRRSVLYHFNKIFARILLAFIAVIAIGCVLRRPIADRYYQWLLEKPKPPQSEAIEKGITIDHIDVAGLTYDEAVEKISSAVDTNTEGTVITIKSTDGSHTYSYTYQDFGIVFDIPAAARKAADFCKDTASEDGFREFKTLEGGNVDFAVMSCNRAQVRSYINAIADEINVDAQDAGLKRVNGQFTVTPSKTGYAIDKDALLNNVYSLIDSRDFGKEVTFEIKVTEPKHKDADVTGITGIIGTFSSPYTGGDANRIQNLRNGCAKINESVVYPNEEFSTNAHFNPCTEANGWASAGTIVNGKIEDSIGGGMCQVSSALYMALLNAEVKITQRYNHSMKVGYADYGFDATLAGDYKDLRFVNDTGCAIYIESYLTASNVVVNIYGKEVHSPGRTLRFYNKFIEERKPGDPITKNDPSLPAGTKKVDVTARNGCVYELYKEVYENGVLKDTVKVNTSTYLPRRQVTLVGTGTAENDT